MPTRTLPGKAQFFWPALLAAFLIDRGTKWFIPEYLDVALPVLGDTIMLVGGFYNRGAVIGHWAWGLLLERVVAMLGLLGVWYLWYRQKRPQNWMAVSALGLVIGGTLGNLLHLVPWLWGRPLLIVRSGVMLLLLGVWYRQLHALDRGAAAALGLVVGGALGNIVDLLRWDGGVLDFIRITGTFMNEGWMRIYNVADICITWGTVWLAWRLCRLAPPQQAER